MLGDTFGPASSARGAGPGGTRGLGEDTGRRSGGPRHLAAPWPVPVPRGMALLLAVHHQVNRKLKSQTPKRKLGSQNTNRIDQIPLHLSVPYTVQGTPREVACPLLHFQVPKRPGSRFRRAGKEVQFERRAVRKGGVFLHTTTTTVRPRPRGTSWTVLQDLR